MNPFSRFLMRHKTGLAMKQQPKQEPTKPEPPNCTCENSYFIKTRIGGTCGRDYIEQMSREDEKHQINSMCKLAEQNAYGEIGSYCPDCENTFPVICGCGGSMWLCRKCADLITTKPKESNKMKDEETKPCAEDILWDVETVKKILSDAKVFCKDCKHLGYSFSHGYGCGEATYLCHHPLNKGDSWLKPDRKFISTPQERNKNNDCGDYEEKT